MENLNSIKVEKRFQKIWEQYKDHHKTEGYELTRIFDIYLPFWQCKQNIVIEKEVELDRFSRIILELISNNITKHTEICSFLGVKEDSFVTTQFHFLLKYDLIRESNGDAYEITHQGISFLQNKLKLMNNETIEFEYFLTERFDYLKNDLMQEFFNPNFPIDKQLSIGKKNNFSGYKVMQTKQVQYSENCIELKHGDKPTFSYINKQRGDFSSFFKNQFQDKNFYDFSDNILEAHKRTICFCGLLFEKPENNQEIKIEIRHSEKTVKIFTHPELEKQLTKVVGDKSILKQFCNNLK